MNRLASNVAANVLSNVWSTALALLLTPVYVGLLGVESYGLIGVHVSSLAILGMLDTALSATAVRELAWRAPRPEERAGIPTLIRTLELFYWAAILAVAVPLFVWALLAGAAWFNTAQLSGETIRTALLLMVGAIVVQMPSGLYIGGLSGLQRQVEASALVACFGTIRGIGAVVVLVAVTPDIRVFFLWQIVASAVQTAATRAALLRHTRGIGERARFSRSALQAVQRFAGGTGLITALTLVVAQGDKVILSRLVSLEAFGLYALAWSVASGLARITLPLVQAFSPRFTELLSAGDTAGLVRHLRVAAQLTNALILPPAVLLLMLATPILLAWLGDPAIAAATAPILSVLAVGTLLQACSYPALSVLFSRAWLKPIIAVNLAMVIVLLPLCAAAIVYFGVMGAAFSWVIYGLASYVCYQAIALRGLDEAPVWPRVLQDFVVPALAAGAVGWIAVQSARHVDGRLETAGIIGAALLVGWGATFVACRDLFRIAVAKWKRYPLSTLWSA